MHSHNFTAGRTSQFSQRANPRNFHCGPVLELFTAGAVMDRTFRSQFPLSLSLFFFFLPFVGSCVPFMPLHSADSHAHQRPRLPLPRSVSSASVASWTSSFPSSPSRPARWRIRSMRSARVSAGVLTAAAYFLFPSTSSHLSMMGKELRKYRATSARDQGGRRRNAHGSLVFPFPTDGAILFLPSKALPHSSSRAARMSHGCHGLSRSGTRRLRFGTACSCSRARRARSRMCRGRASSPLVWTGCATN